MLTRSMRWILLFIALASLSSQVTALTQDDVDVEWGPWWVLLPIEHKPGGQKINKVYPPEKKVKAQRAGTAGPDLEAKFRGGEKREIGWRQVRESTAQAPDFGPLDFVQLVGSAGFENAQAASNNALAYVYRSLTCSQAKQLEVTFGSDDSCRVWLNGRLIDDFAGARGLDPESDHLTLDLKRGVNHLFVKVANGGGAWGAQIQPRPGRGDFSKPPVSPDAINEAIDRGMVYLLQTQHLDGSWAFDQANFRNGQTSLATYALLKSGLTADHPAVQRALAFLRLHPPVKTYSLVCQMLALHSTKRPDDLSYMLELGAELEQWEDFAFAYPEGTADLSNTQYGALGLWVHQEAGGRISVRTLIRVLHFTLSCQDSSGGFAYRPGGVATGAMTVAGLMSIRACELGMQGKGIPNGLKREIGQATASGMAWLEANFRVDHNPATTGNNRWNYYYLYGVERMAALMAIDTIDGRDWYQEGARYLVGAQTVDGGWKTVYGEGGPNTSFALLFLSRSTATLTGKRKFSRHRRIYGSDTPDAKVIMRAAGDTPLDIWVSAIEPATLKQHSRDGPGGHGLYIEHVEYLCDGAVIHTAESDTSSPWKLQRFEFQHRFATRGFHELEVHLFLAPATAQAIQEPVVLASPSMKVRIDGLMEPWMLDYPNDSIDNLTSLTDVVATASSQRGAGNRAAWAVDGSMVRGWSCAADDGDPTLTLEFKRALRADRVVFSHRTSTEAERAKFDRATRCELLVRGRKEPIEFSMDPNPEHKTVVMLPKEMRVSELRIRVLERLRGTAYAGSVGFAEVELRLGN